jgi:ABC-type nitrate/sulfonate/bicarbonate transport system substrate-binding protein
MQHKLTTEQERDDTMNLYKLLARRLCSCLMISLVLVFSNNQYGNAAPAKAGDALTPLKVTVFPYLSFAPIYIAQSEGYFTKNGLDVELVRFQSNSESLAALLSGQVDVDTIFNVGVLNAIIRGENVRIVANKGVLDPGACPADGFMIRSELVEKLNNPSAEFLKTLTYGVDPVWLDSYFLEILLAGFGVDRSEVKTTYIPNPAARMEALTNGTLDVAFVSEPFIRRMVDNGGVMWKSAAEIAPNFSLGVITFGPNLLEKNKDGDTGVRFLKAYLQGIDQLKEGKTDRNLEIISGFSKLSKETLERICWPSYSDDGSIEADIVVGYADWAARQKLSDRALVPEELWNSDFVKKAAYE